jgi:hypothetical protein
VIEPDPPPVSFQVCSIEPLGALSVRETCRFDDGAALQVPFPVSQAEISQADIEALLVDIAANSKLTWSRFVPATWPDTFDAQDTCEANGAWLPVPRLILMSPVSAILALAAVTDLTEAAADIVGKSTVEPSQPTVLRQASTPTVERVFRRRI